MAMFNIPKPVKPRGIRFSLPAGFVLGRVSPGYGDAELIPIDQLAQQQLKTGILAPGPVAGGGVTTLNYDLGVVIPSVANLIYNQYLFAATASLDLLMPSTSGVLDVAKCAIAPTTTVTFYLVNDPSGYEADGVTGIIATVVFSASSTTGVITWAAPSVAVARGDMLRLYSSSAFVDTTITGIELLFTADAA